MIRTCHDVSRSFECESVLNSSDFIAARSAKLDSCNFIYDVNFVYVFNLSTSFVPPSIPLVK